MTTVEWEELPEQTRAAVESHTGPLVKVEPVTAGHNHHLAAILHSDTGAVFVKGLRTGHRHARRQQLEAVVNGALTGITPRLQWQLPDVGGWHLLGFDALTGARHTDLRPGSTDLPLVTDALSALAQTRRPPGAVPDRAEHRWAEHGNPDQVHVLRGQHLLHTDLRPDNIVIDAGRVWIVDWAWPTLGAAWIDPARLTLWLIAEGHTTTAAESWLRTLPAQPVRASRRPRRLHRRGAPSVDRNRPTRPGAVEGPPGEGRTRVARPPQRQQLGPRHRPSTLVHALVWHRSAWQVPHRQV